MRPALVPLFVLAFIALTACASIEKERGHAEVAQLVEQRSGRKTGWHEGTPEAEKLRARARELAGLGLNRERVMELALLGNKRLQATYEELGISQAEMLQAGLLSNPSISGSVGFPLAEGILETEFEIVQQFLDLLVLPLRKRIAADQFAADISRVANEALAVAAEASEAFTELQAAQKNLELQQLVVTAASASADLAQKQHRAGNINDLELAEQRADFAEARLELSRDEQNLIEAREVLNRQLGLFGPEAEWKLAAQLPELPAVDPPLEEVERRAIRERLDLDAARKVSELMSGAVSLAKVTRLGGMLALGVHTHQDPDGPRLTGPSIEIELPIFDQRQATIGRLEAEARVAERNLEALAIEVRADVRLGRSRLQLARATVEFYRRELLPLREQLVAQAQLQYNGMQIGLYGLLRAKREQVHGYRDYVDAVRGYWVARAQLERAVGGALEGPEKAPEKDLVLPIQTTTRSGAHHEH